MRQRIGWLLVVGVLIVTGVLGVANGVRGAIAAGVASALIGAAVVWGPRAAVRFGRRAGVGARARGVVSAALLAACVVEAGACRQLYTGPPSARPPTIGDMDGLRTKRVRAKREPDVLIAEDLTECSVAPEVFRGVRPGDHWRCAWRPVP